MTIFKKTMLAGALAATTIASATPAMARDNYRGNDNTAAVAIGAGILGLAVGALITSDNNDRYYDYDRAGYGPAYTSGWELRNGYYWDRDGRRHTRDEYARYQRGPQNGDRGPQRDGTMRGDDMRGGNHMDQRRGR